MDEAYIEFLDKPVDLLPVIRSRSKPNLLLMRTFSKIYGLAGLRIGYGIGHVEVVAAVERIRQPFNINAASQAAALAALEDQEHVDRTRQNNALGLAFFQKACNNHGLTFVPSSANFILVNVQDGQAVFQGLQQRGVIVRPMGGYGLPEWIRISIGTPAENERCWAALKEVLASRGGGR
jgi:histidinol-phosphate aminotransferase